MRLATKISTTVVGVLLLALISSAAGLVCIYQLSSMMQTMVHENVESVRAAEELEIALLEQRGHVSAFLLSGGDRRWLDGLAAKQAAFDRSLRTVRNTAYSEEERELLERLQEVFTRYDARRDEVVSLYEKGDQQQAERILLSDVQELYDEAYKLCEEFIGANQRFIDARTAAADAETRRMTWVLGLTTGSTLCLGLVLLWLFFQGVLAPLRRMAVDARLAAGAPADAGRFDDELRTVGLHLRLLMTDIRTTRSDLEHSRDRLAHSEKLASVGKLAAGVAHEIRNPLTSIKMWLFSLRKASAGRGELDAKFDLISEEITRLEGIIHNFLEFSRPPALQVSSRCLSAILDKTLELLHHRLANQQIEVQRREDQPLPPVLADAEQLKQVLINLIDNALDAMPQGGRLKVDVAVEQQEGRTMVVVRVADSGPGMPEDVRARIFEPFFSTKEKGTGLGLCIAASVMAAHDGRLILEATGSRGTEFAIWIPTAGPAP